MIGKIAIKHRMLSPNGSILRYIINPTETTVGLMGGARMSIISRENNGLIAGSQLNAGIFRACNKTDGGPILLHG